MVNLNLETLPRIAPQSCIYLQGHNSDGNIKNFATINAYSTGIDTGDLAFNVRRSNALPDEEVMRINSAGNVDISGSLGVGVTPQEKLHVNGTVMLYSQQQKQTKDSVSSVLYWG